MEDLDPQKTDNDASSREEKERQITSTDEKLNRRRTRAVGICLLVPNMDTEDAVHSLLLHFYSLVPIYTVGCENNFRISYLIIMSHFHSVLNLINQIKNNLCPYSRYFLFACFYAQCITHEYIDLGVQRFC